MFGYMVRTGLFFVISGIIISIFVVAPIFGMCFAINYIKYHYQLDLTVVGMVGILLWSLFFVGASVAYLVESKFGDKIIGVVFDKKQDDSNEPPALPYRRVSYAELGSKMLAVQELPQSALACYMKPEGYQVNVQVYYEDSEAKMWSPWFDTPELACSYFSNRLRKGSLLKINKVVITNLIQHPIKIINFDSPLNEETLVKMGTIKPVYDELSEKAKKNYENIP